LRLARSVLAFRDHFWVTPEAVRATTWRDQLELQEPILIYSTGLGSLAPRRFETGKAMLIAGLGDRFSHDNGAPVFPGLWQRFHQHLNHWLPALGLQTANAPNFARYDEKFDPATGNGGLQIWIPITV